MVANVTLLWKFIFIPNPLLNGPKGYAAVTGFKVGSKAWLLTLLPQ